MTRFIEQALDDAIAPTLSPDSFIFEFIIYDVQLRQTLSLVRDLFIGSIEDFLQPSAGKSLHLPALIIHVAHRLMQEQRVLDESARQ
jgi:hypothetical protein